MKKKKLDNIVKNQISENNKLQKKIFSNLNDNLFYDDNDVEFNNERLKLLTNLNWNIANFEVNLKITNKIYRKIEDIYNKKENLLNNELFIDNIKNNVLNKNNNVLLFFSKKNDESIMSKKDEKLKGDDYFNKMNNGNELFDKEMEEFKNERLDDNDLKDIKLKYITKKNDVYGNECYHLILEIDKMTFINNKLKEVSSLLISDDNIENLTPFKENLKAYNILSFNENPLKLIKKYNKNIKNICELWNENSKYFVKIKEEIDTKCEKNEINVFKYINNFTNDVIREDAKHKSAILETTYLRDSFLKPLLFNENDELSLSSEISEKFKFDIQRYNSDLFASNSIIEQAESSNLFEIM